MKKVERRLEELYVKAGQLLLFTSGSYSDKGVSGIYRAKVDVRMPVKPDGYGGEDYDTARVSGEPTLVEELEYEEVWGGDI